MTSIADNQIDPVDERPRVEEPAREPLRSRVAPLIAMGLILLPVNVGILLYTAKNASELRESQESLAALTRSIDGLKQQIDKQARHIAKGAKAEDVASVRSETEGLRTEVAVLNDQMRSGMISSGGRVIMSAPGKEPTQRFVAVNPTYASLPVDDESLATVEAKGVSLSNLPRYERSVSPEGKLILRKVQ